MNRSFRLLMLGRPRWVALPVLALWIAVLAAACDGDGSGPGGDPDIREQLQAMVLRVEDVSPGFVAGETTFSTNEDVVGSREDPEAELNKLEEQGRLLSYQVVFEPGPDAGPDVTVIGIENSVSLYRRADGAAASFAEAVQEARTTDWQATHPGLLELEVQEIERPELADEVLWLRISGFQSEERDAVAFDDFVLLRRGEVRAFIRVVSFYSGEVDRGLNLEEVEGWAARQVQKIDDVLAEQS